MSEPKYHVGQDVAVCTSDMRTVFPATKVISIKYLGEGHGLNDRAEPARRPAGFYYQVDVLPVVLDDLPNFYHERCLRPINPDTEYTEDTQDITQPITEGANV